MADPYGVNTMVSNLQNVNTNIPVPQSQPGFSFANLFSDPNFIRVLGEQIAPIAGPQSFGARLGAAGGALTRARQLQAAAAKQAQTAQTLQQRASQALLDGTLLGRAEDGGTFDKAVFDNAGGFTLTRKPAPEQPSFQGEQQPLEAQTQRGTGLRDFFRASLG